MEAEGNYGYRHILKYTSIFGSVQGLNIVAALIRNKFAALFLGPAGMGLASLLTVTMNFLSQTAGMGLSLSATRYFSAYYDKVNQQRIDHLVNVVRVWCLLASLLGILLSLIAGYWTMAPAVAVTIIGGGEMSILKGARRLRSLAVIQTIAAIASVVISVPLYWKFGQDAIVAVINLMAFATMLPAIYASYRLFTPRFSFTHQVMGEGVSMLRLGVAFTLAAMAGSGAELFIRRWLEIESGLGDVGLYNAGYLLTVTYMGVVFAAMDNDYYPRLSAVSEAKETNTLVNRQMEVLLWLVTPFLALMILCLPWLVPLLLSSNFSPIVIMAQIAAVSLVFKAATLPVAYITLARGRSVAYLICESAYYMVFASLVIVGYRKWGVTGTGVAILIAHVFDFLMIHLYAYHAFGYRLSVRTLCIIIAALTIVSAALWVGVSVL